jgi:multidrug efflux system membrane fusion protein
VLENLAANETVVVEGADRLREGGQIDVSEKDGLAVAAVPTAQGKPDKKSHKKNL